MCDMISWVEVEDPKNPLAKKIVFFLTDKEVFSAKGKKMFKDGKSDVLGHGAIRKYFGIKEGRGEDMEVTLFWNDEGISCMPPEVAAAVRNFDANFGEMFSSGCFDGYDLFYIIDNAPDEWAEKAWQQLLRQLSGNKLAEVLGEIISSSPPTWSGKAWKHLRSLSRSSQFVGLCRVIGNDSDAKKSTQDRVMRIFSKMGLTKQQWRAVFRSAGCYCQKETLRLIFRLHKFSNRELISWMQSAGFSEVETIILTKIGKQQPTKNYLLGIATKTNYGICNNTKLAAAKMLLARFKNKLTENDLDKITTTFPELILHIGLGDI